MPVTVRLDDERLNPSFVAYNLVFGPDTNGLPDITAEGLSEAMAARGFDLGSRDAAAMLHEWYDGGLLRWRDGQYVVA